MLLGEHDVGMNPMTQIRRTENSTSFPSKLTKTFPYCGEALPGSVSEVAQRQPAGDGSAESNSRIPPWYPECA